MLLFKYCTILAIVGMMYGLVAAHVSHPEFQLF